MFLENEGRLTSEKKKQVKVFGKKILAFNKYKVFRKKTVLYGVELYWPIYI